MNKTADVGKENIMDEMSALSELLVEKTEENQTRKILEMLKESKNLSEAIEKVEALLK